MIGIGTVQDSVHTALERNGYAIIPSFISPKQITQLQDFFSETVNQSDVDVAFFTTHWSANKSYRQQVNDFVSGKLKPALDGHFVGYKCLFGYFLYKKPSADGGVYMHKDWTLIDEEEFVGYTLWIPLIDTTNENGCFQVVPGSHLNAEPRGSNIPQEYAGITEEDFTPIPARAGDAIIFDHRLLHASAPNRSGADRLSVGLIIVPEKASVIHYWHTPESGETKVFEVGDDFLVKSFYDYKKHEPSDYILNMINNSEYYIKEKV